MTQALDFLDDKAIAQWMEANVAGFHDLSEIKKFYTGQSNPTYLVTAQSGKYVLRAKPPGELLKSAHMIEREYRVMKALENSPIPVPKMLAISNEKDNPLGRTCFVMEHLDGHIFRDLALPELAGEGIKRRAKIYDAMNETLAALHQIDFVQIGLSDFGKPENYYEQQLGQWIRQYADSETDRNEDIHTLADWLAINMPADDGMRSLIHGEYRLDNIVFSRDASTIIGVLDWELSTIGHPLADLAYQCMQWRLPHEGSFRGLGGVNKPAIGIPGEQDYVATYCQRRGMAPIENWNFYLAFCFFRMAATLQGVYKRSLDGNASNPQKAKEYGKAVPVLGSMALNIVRQ